MLVCIPANSVLRWTGLCPASGRPLVLRTRAGQYNRLRPRSGILADRPGSLQTMTRTAKLTFGDQTIELPVIEGTEGELALDISSLRAQTGLITLDPGFGNTGVCRSAITYIDGEKGILRYRGIPDRAARRALELRRDRVPADLRPAARPRASSTLPGAADRQRAAPRVVQAPLRGLPGRRPADGHALGHGQHPGLLPPQVQQIDRGGVRRGGGLAAQQGPDDRGLLVPPLAGPAVHLPRSRSCPTRPTSCT